MVEAVARGVVDRVSASAVRRRLAEDPLKPWRWWWRAARAAARLAELICACERHDRIAWTRDGGQATLMVQDTWAVGDAYESCIGRWSRAR